MAWGAIAASSLLIGGFVALRARPSDRLVGLVLAFGAGTLISAVAYELVPEEPDYPVTLGLALGLGAIVFFVGDAIVERLGGENRKELDAVEQGGSGSGPAIVLGTVLDGIPESLVLGIGLWVGGAVSVAFLAAVFISNLPEAIAATASLRAAGRSTRSIYFLWTAIVGVSAVAAGVGYAIASATSAGADPGPGLRGRRAVDNDHRHDGARSCRARRKGCRPGDHPRLRRGSDPVRSRVTPRTPPTVSRKQTERRSRPSSVARLCGQYSGSSWD